MRPNLKGRTILPCSRGRDPHYSLLEEWKSILHEQGRNGTEDALGARGARPIRNGIKTPSGRVPPEEDCPHRHLGKVRRWAGEGREPAEVKERLEVARSSTKKKLGITRRLHHQEKGAAWTYTRGAQRGKMT